MLQNIKCTLTEIAFQINVYFQQADLSRTHSHLTNNFPHPLAKIRELTYLTIFPDTKPKQVIGEKMQAQHGGILLNYAVE